MPATIDKIEFEENNHRFFPLPSLTEDQRTPTAGTAFLEITRVQLSDTGTYTCSAMNIAGRSEEQVQVVVDVSDQGRPSPLPSLPPEEENVFPLHTEANIRCSYG